MKKKKTKNKTTPYNKKLKIVSEMQVQTNKRKYQC